MHVISVRNVHQALPVACSLLANHGVRRHSRNGDVLQSHMPVATVYSEPVERVVFWPQRDANPFFHFYESLWMLAGRRDVAPLRYYVERMWQFSDDQETFYGAYGYRWRKNMPADAEISGNFDQLDSIVNILSNNPDDRRCVLQMWDSRSDLGHIGNDVPCNLTITFQRRSDGTLDMVVFNRSNDIVWGAYGANAVHMSFLLEYMAARIGAPIGTYTQISVNWHGYTNTFAPLVERFDSVFKNFHDAAEVMEQAHYDNPYVQNEVAAYPLMQTPPAVWQTDLMRFMRDTHRGGFPQESSYEDPFFNEIALPMVRSFARYKTQEGAGRFEDALKELDRMPFCDWNLACVQWIKRREEKFFSKETNNV